MDRPESMTDEEWEELEAAKEQAFEAVQKAMAGHVSMLSRYRVLNPRRPNRAERRRRR